jgi:hypothetical protein
MKAAKNASLTQDQWFYAPTEIALFTAFAADSCNTLLFLLFFR